MVKVGSSPGPNRKPNAYLFLGRRSPPGAHKFTDNVDAVAVHVAVAPTFVALLSEPAMFAEAPEQLVTVGPDGRLLTPFELAVPNFVVGNVSVVVFTVRQGALAETVAFTTPFESPNAGVAATAPPRLSTPRTTAKTTRCIALTPSSASFLYRAGRLTSNDRLVNRLGPLLSRYSKSLLAATIMSRFTAKQTT